jgi:hypothetical protein
VDIAGGCEFRRIRAVPMRPVRSWGGARRPRGRLQDPGLARPR